MKLLSLLLMCLAIIGSVHGGGGVNTTCDVDGDCNTAPCIGATSGFCGCADDTECVDAAEPKCVNNICRECGDDTDCTVAPNTLCVSNECVECLIDDDCDGDEVCNDMGECVDPCTAGSCDPGETCNTATGLCEDGCSASDPCPAGQSCNEDTGQCETDCNPSCGENEVCTIGRQCVCDDTHVRVNGTCVLALPECRETNDCRNEGEVCNSDNLCECAPNRRLSPGRCVAAGYLGGSCVGGRCRGKRVKCNSMNICVCAGGCDATTVCLRRRRYW